MELQKIIDDNHDYVAFVVMLVIFIYSFYRFHKGLAINSKMVKLFIGMTFIGVLIEGIHIYSKNY
jgi:hypothetical protein